MTSDEETGIGRPKGGGVWMDANWGGNSQERIKKKRWINGTKQNLEKWVVDKRVCVLI